MNVATHIEVKPTSPEPVSRAAARAAQAMEEAPPRLFTVNEFHRMLEGGVFGDDARLELLEGVVVSMTTQGPAPALAIRRLSKWFTLQIGDDFVLLPQLPVTLGPSNEPVPDLAVVRAGEGSNEAHPTSALLVIEVADTTLRKDRGLKQALYARHNVPEYWIVNVKNATIEVHRDPDSEAGRYRTLVTMAPPATLSPVGVPGVSISLADLFA